MSNKFDFPSSPYPKQVWPEQKIEGKPQYIWSSSDRAWFKYNIEQYNIVPTFLSSVNEGETIDFLIQTSGVTDGTLVRWRIEHITTEESDFSGSPGGAIAINNNQATLNILISNEDGDNDDFEEFRVILERGDGLEVAKSPIVSIRNTTAPDNRVYSIVPDSNTIIEGSSITFYIFTQNVDPDPGDPYKILDWEISGTDIEAADLGLNQLTGTLELNSSGNGSITFITSNEMILDGGSPIYLNFVIKDDVNGSLSSVAKSMVVIKDIIAELPPSVDTLTVNPTSINSGESTEVSWSGLNLTSNDVIRMFSNTDTTFTNPIQTKSATGQDTGSLIFSNITNTISSNVLFGYYAINDEDPPQEKLLKTSENLAITVQTPPDNGGGGGGGGSIITPTLELEWTISSILFGSDPPERINIENRTSETFKVTGFSSTWQYSYRLEYIKGNKSTSIRLSTSATSPVYLIENGGGLISRTYTFGENQSYIDFTIKAGTSGSLTSGMTYPASFTLTSAGSPSSLKYNINFVAA